jgi:hypothetical protein
MTYQVDGKIVATASGLVENLAPRQARAVVLESRAVLPVVRQVVYTLRLVRTPRPEGSLLADVTRQIKFGPWQELPDVGLDVEVTNGGATTRSLRLQALLFGQGGLVGIATGSVMNLAPGQTKLATLLAIGPPPPYDRVSFAVDALLE